MFRYLLLSILLINFYIPTTYANEPGVADFDVGVKYFKQKKYKAALQYFNKAKKFGMKKSSLSFNLAVSYYKLGQYKKAKFYFSSLTKNKKLQQISLYNLGLIAEKLKQNRTAINWYKKVIAKNNSNKLAQLANNKLDVLLKRKRKQRAKTNAAVSLAFGNDDNITNSTVTSPSNKSDQYLQLFTYFNHTFSNNLNLKGTLYNVDYNTQNTQDFIFYSAAINYDFKTNGWKLSPEVSLLNSYLNNTSYQNIQDFKLTANRNLKDKSTLSLRYRFSNINAVNTAYNYLEGTRNQFRANYKTRMDLIFIRLTYQLETNDRNNSATKNYSPVRHNIRIRFKQKLADWEVSEEIDYRNSQYGDALGVIRNDKRLRLNISANKKLSESWAGGIRYSHTNNDSNVASEIYTRNKIQIFIKSKY